MMRQAKKLLKQYFGFDSFRPLQAEIIEAVVQGKDTLVLMPTGGGKSLCYQLPALMMPGVSVVVSPLISLMKDQVEALRANGIEAEFLNSSLSSKAALEVVARLKAGKVKLVYVAPERLVTERFLALLKEVRVNLLVVDEAHCISVWGHSFRKDYTELKLLRREFPATPIMALTATADTATREDIVKQLRLTSVQKFIASFDRPNIAMSVLPATNRARVVEALVRERQDQAGIIYCLSRKETERLAERLRQAGIKAEAYHAEVEGKERAKRQEAFLKDEIEVMCATVAFGMGIDKSNVRYVIHHNVPGNIESYYQEIGRAGRDGLASEAILFYSSADVARRRQMLWQDDLEDEERRVKLKKLEVMVRWAEGIGCRRSVILDYFGETMEKCGNCDICLEPPLEFDGTEVVQKLLSVLARVKRPLALGTVVGILGGSEAEYIRREGFDRIKTYGRGRDIPASVWRQYWHQVVEMGLVRYVREERGWVVSLQGELVLYGKQAVKLKQSPLMVKRKEVVAKVKKQRVDEGGYEVGLFEALRQLRRKLAEKQGVPAYIVFSDATLKQMAVLKPHDKQSMLAVSGVGMMKWERYGEDFLEVLKGWKARE